MPPIGLALAAFVIFCALSGVVYLINDVADREADRRIRSSARGRSRPAPCRSGGADAARRCCRRRAGGGLALRPLFGVIASTYLVLLALYSGPLKHIVIIDVLTIAIGFVLRAIAGAVAIDVAFSHWLCCARSCWRCFSR